MQGIYKVTNIITGETYVGQSKNIEMRWNYHKCPSRAKTTNLLDNAIGLYGASNFVFEVIEEVTDSSELLTREKFWITKLKPSYNKQLTGKQIFCAETKHRLSILGKEQWNGKTQEEKDFIIKNNLTGPKVGYEVSNATKQKLRKANIGKKQSVETISKRAEKLKVSLKGNVNGNKTIVALFEDGSLYKVFESVKSASIFFGVNASCITGVLKGRRKHTCGYKWAYYKDWSVETNGDECSRVGAILPRIEVRDNLNG